MYKLLIVDDEPLVQVGIKSMLNWNDFDIEVCGTAANGEMALNIIEEKMPDIVITDIKMPILSGLDLVKACKERFGKLPAFIILTSYEDFQLAKQAVSYQVIDYLVKLELNADILKESIKKAISFVDENKTITNDENSFLMTSSALLQERFFVKLVNNLFVNEKEFELQKNELSLSFSEIGSCVGYFKINTTNADNMSNSQLLNLYSSTIQMFKQLIVKYLDCYIISLDIRHFMIIFNVSSTDETFTKNEIFRAIENTRTMLKNYYNTEIYSGIGRIVPTALELSTSYYDARQVLAKATADKPCFFYDELISSDQTKNVFNMSIFNNDIRTAYEEMDSDKLDTIFKTITDLFMTYPTHYVQAMDAAGSILYLTISLLPNGENVVCDIFKDFEDNYRSLYKLNSTEQIVSWLWTLCNGLKGFFNNQKKDFKNHIVTNVKAYINENVDKKLSLNEVAASFGISPTYLSILFGKYSDIGFIEYVNYAKINSAKEMLKNTNYKVYEIADKLGFESAFYFSKVFKRVEGCSPREYLSKL